jgi:hypothetical protein
MPRKAAQNRLQGAQPERSGVASTPVAKPPKSPIFRLRSRVPSEASEQEALFAWARMAARKDARLELLFAVPNGTSASSIAEAMKAKRTGRKRGVPDVCLPVASQGKHGLFLELKRRDGSASDLSDAQGGWLDRLDAQGYRALVCFGWEHAQREIEHYLREVKE